MLHTINKSAHTSTLLQSCLATLQAGDCVVLLNDGVYGATQASPCAERINALAAGGECRFYALQADVEKRGIGSLLTCVEVIEYSRFVELVAQQKKTQSWY